LLEKKVGIYTKEKPDKECENVDVSIHHITTNCYYGEGLTRAPAGLVEPILICFTNIRWT